MRWHPVPCFASARVSPAGRASPLLMSSSADTAGCRCRLIGAAMLCAALLMTGCQIVPKTSGESSKSDWVHSNLYNSRAAYPKLFVEIDVVAGQGPTRSELRDLEAFLRQYCDKPGGITIKVDNVIPRRAVVGRPAELLALEYLNGPPDDQSAFLYILFYNTRLRGKDVLTDAPSFSPLPHPIVWIDRSYRFLGNPWPSTFRRTVLLHEIGHALGLCATSNHHATGGHCTNDDCRMNPALNFDLRRFVLLRNPWSNRSLCAECAGDLARNKESPVNPTLDFWHGYFRRREEGYQVLGIPGLTYVHFGDPLVEPSEALKQTRREALAKLIQTKDTAFVSIEAFDPWEHFPAFKRFTTETNYGLRLVTQEVFAVMAKHIAELAKTDMNRAREYLSDELIALACDYPEQHRKFTELRAELHAARTDERPAARAGN